MSLSDLKGDEEVSDIGLITPNEIDADLENYEELFANRYSDKDDVYMEAVRNPPKSPPIVHPWYNKPRRNFNYTGSGSRNDFHSGGYDRNEARYNHYRGPRDQQRDQNWHDRNHSRDRRRRSRSPMNKGHNQ